MEWVPPTAETYHSPRFAQRERPPALAAHASLARIQAREAVIAACSKQAFAEPGMPEQQQSAASTSYWRRFTAGAARRPSVVMSALKPQVQAVQGQLPPDWKAPSSSLSLSAPDDGMPDEPPQPLRSTTRLIMPPLAASFCGPAVARERAACLPAAQLLLSAMASSFDEPAAAAPSTVAQPPHHVDSSALASACAATTRLPGCNPTSDACSPATPPGCGDVPSVYSKQSQLLGSVGGASLAAPWLSNAGVNMTRVAETASPAHLSLKKPFAPVPKKKHCQRPGTQRHGFVVGFDFFPAVTAAERANIRQTRQRARKRFLEKKRRQTAKPTVGRYLSRTR
eukprot:SAG31_NODE_4712_length_3016_cov_1.839218_1_plen_338_part_10